jgi:hypothetical protein
LFHVVPYVVSTFDNGVGITNGPSVKTLLLSELRFPNATTNDAETSLKLGPWLAVITLTPGPIIVTVRPDMVATCVLLLVYVNATALFDVGSTRLNEASPYTLAGTVNVPVTDVIGFTVNDAVVLAAA